MTRASSAARKGAAMKAVIATAPIAAAQSEKRLNWLRRMTGPLGLGDSGNWGSLGWGPDFAIGAGLPDVPRYAAAGVLLRPNGHEFVNKSSPVQGVSAAAASSP